MTTMGEQFDAVETAGQMQESVPFFRAYFAEIGPELEPARARVASLRALVADGMVARLTALREEFRPHPGHARAPGALDVAASARERLGNAIEMLTISLPRYEARLGELEAPTWEWLGPYRYSRGGKSVTELRGMPGAEWIHQIVADAGAMRERLATLASYAAGRPLPAPGVVHVPSESAGHDRPTRAISSLAHD